MLCVSKFLKYLPSTIRLLQLDDDKMTGVESPAELELLYPYAANLIIKNI